ncbi:hypothetical protein [Actinotalea solisilvae]|uniref:hypothetical protein n=1 Tax=Actinotalea solisilvae TaxID=2072922 RepID=UPI0018F27230|nr:hypothetical protein [Actinotalea solisilvae]
MPTRLLLDGEDLRSLMLRVKAEMGPGARIVKAERIRTGGIGGFFAKEHYELTVEVPDPVHPGRRLHERRASGAPAGGRPAGIEALLAAADAAEDAEVLGGAAPGGGSAPAPARDAAAPAPAQPAPDAEEADAPPVPEISTTGPTFAEVLESLGQLVGPQDDAAAGEATGDLVVRPAAGPVVATAPREPDARPEQPEQPEPHGATVGALLELGLPAALLAGLGDLRAPVPLSRLVRRFPAGPVLRLDAGVVAVVGEPDAALRTAMQMAYRAGIDPHDVVVAGDLGPVPGHGRRVQTAAAAARLRSRAGEGATLVAVGVDADGGAAAADLLEALAPDQCWAAVDAGRRVAETRRWLREVGARRPFDAVAAMGTFHAQSPGAVLNLGVPVGWVDGLPVSPVVWAAVLSERLAEDASWD